jgi:hypothetical protein
VAYWKGDGDAKDSIGRSDGQGFGGLRYVPGPAGQAFQFNGGDAKVDFGNSAGNFGTNDFTIAYWMKTDSKNPHEAFLGKRAVCDSIISFWDILIAVTGNSPPGSISLSVDPGGSRAPFSLASSRPVNDGQWHHVAWVRQSAISGNVTYLVYIDGALDNSQACAEAWDLANSTSLVMGKSVCEGHDGCAPYSGAVAELQLFSQALSADEILAVFHAAKPEK